jgi:hypothetical protein
MYWQSLAITGRNDELTTLKFIMTQEHTFKWHRTVSDKVARTLLKITSNEKLINKSNTKGPLVRMLKQDVIMAEGMYLLVNRYATNTQSLKC